MSRLVPKVPQPPPYLGTGLVLNTATGLFDVATVTPQPLSGAILGTDAVLIERNIGTVAAPNWQPFYATPAQVQALGGGSGAATTSPTPTPTTTPAPTPTPTPTSIPADGTLSGLPLTISAGQQLSAAYVTSQTSLYFVLYNVATAAEEGLRWPPNTVVAGTLSVLVPQNAGAYTVRGFAAFTGGTATYESPHFNVTAAPGALPATPTQTADTGATATGVTMNWSSTAPSYLVLARPGVGTAYGILANTTVNTNSITFAHLSANSSPRAVIIPQNANGYGTAALCLSSVTATAVANETLTLASPGPQTSNSAFTLTGTYSGITPTTLDYQYAGQPAWNTALPQNVTIANGTFTIAGVLARFSAPNMVYSVRDHDNPANTATTPAFAVS